jgi:hypothetical protein
MVIVVVQFSCCTVKKWKIIGFAFNVFSYVADKFFSWVKGIILERFLRNKFMFYISQCCLILFLH